MTREEEIRARLENATGGTWTWEALEDSDWPFRLNSDASANGYVLEACVPADDNPYDLSAIDITNGDCEFIANAPRDIDYLLNEIQKMREENSRLGIEVLELNQQIGELKFDINIKVSVLKSVESIINNSHGVSGWHMNSEIATWGELGLDDEIAQALQGDTE